MPAIGRETVLKIFRNMVRLRCLDDKIDEMIAAGIGITQHSTRGQEATTVAACAALEEHDYVMPYHRGWGWAIGKGMDPKILLAEVVGKKTGCCAGKGGVHIADWNLRIMGRPGVQAAHVPIAAGVGLSIKFRKTRDVVLCFFGDGASNEGNVHEGRNLASVWKAPASIPSRRPANSSTPPPPSARASSSSAKSPAQPPNSFSRRWTASRRNLPATPF